MKPPKRTGKRLSPQSSERCSSRHSILSTVSALVRTTHHAPYVERLVVATIVEPLREDWRNLQATAETKRVTGDLKGAAAETFMTSYARTRVLDPACGTGNFLYVSLGLMKRLEGEVLEALIDLVATETSGTLLPINTRTNSTGFVRKPR